MWQSLINFIFDFLGMLGELVHWLNTPLFAYESDIPLGLSILGRLGVNISWIYGLTPLTMMSTAIISLIGTILLIKFVGLILDAIPIF